MTGGLPRDELTPGANLRSELRGRAPLLVPLGASPPPAHSVLGVVLGPELPSLLRTAHDGSWRNVPEVIVEGTSISRGAFSLAPGGASS